MRCPLPVHCPLPVARATQNQRFLALPAGGQRNANDFWRCPLAGNATPTIFGVARLRATQRQRFLALVFPGHDNLSMTTAFSFITKFIYQKANKIYIDIIDTFIQNLDISCLAGGLEICSYIVHLCARTMKNVILDLEPRLAFT